MLFASIESWAPGFIEGEDAGYGVGEFWVAGDVIAATTGADASANGALVSVTATALAGAAGPAQIVVPIADIAANGWLPSSGSDLYPMVADENTGTFIYSPSNPTTQQFEVKLASYTDPSIDDGFTLWVDLQAINQDTNFDLDLVQGTTVLDSWTEAVTLAQGIVTRAHPVAPAVIANISDPANVRVRGVARA